MIQYLFKGNYLKKCHATFTFQCHATFLDLNSNFSYNSAATWLLVTGCIMISTNSLKIAAHYTKTKMDDRIVEMVIPFLDFVGFCVILWGTVTVFGKCI